MKTPPSVFRISLATITVAAACIGTPWGAVNVQSMATNNASATLAFPSTQANPTATLPATPLLATSVVQVRALTYGVGEVVKLHQAGIDKDIIVNYINNSDLPYNLTADGILYLQSLGVPKEITTALIQRAGQLRQQQASQQYHQAQNQLQATTPPPGGAIGVQPPAQVITPTTSAPAVTMMGSDYPVYDYGYPDSYNGGAYDYWPPVIIGGGGWGFGGFGGGFGGFRGGSRFGGGGGAHGGFGGGHGGGHR
jgi:hypothetical protein